MNLWFLCCLLMFMVSQGYGWLNQQPWFVVPDLALPWILLGGVGLAIASNRQPGSVPSHLDQLGSQDSPDSPSTLQPIPGRHVVAETSTERTSRQNQLGSKTASSISFEITPRSSKSHR